MRFPSKSPPALLTVLTALASACTSPNHEPRIAPDRVETPAPSSGERPCASTAECREGERCSTETGDCRRPPGCGPEDICAEVCYGICAAAGAGAEAKAKPAEPKPSDAPAPGAAGEEQSAGAKEAPSCRSASDCRAFSFPCDGCQCLALGASAEPPQCKGKPVRCFADPCMNREAVCREGRCQIAGPEPRTE